MLPTRSKTWSWTDEVLPFVVMVTITCLEVGNGHTDDSESSYEWWYGQYCLYRLPFFSWNIDSSSIFHCPYLQKCWPSSTQFPSCFQILHPWAYRVFLYTGISYSSPIMSSAIKNLTPANTFLLAVIFRMEKIDIRSSSSRAKLLGTITAMSGAMVFTLYQGPEIFQMNPSPDSPNQLLLSQPSNWVIGGLLLVISEICSSLWSVLQTATTREYPDQFTIVFFYCLFGTIQCIALSLVVERNPSVWVLQPGIEMFAVVFGAVFLTAIKSNAATWCLRKKGPVFVAMFSPLSIVMAVILGVTFLGDSLHLGSAIGAAIVAAGFYTVMWGEAKQKNKLPMVMEEDLLR